ncbi:uncharacterized protein LOC143185984 [Calliopsis andreniformis]|uniref:uncharacterized protein LOC143185984 n=1 Tax=Calliopsis andreniformis TaxID=337506 RepID=UPI003FCC66CC
MKERDNCYLNESSKRNRGKSKKYNSSRKLFIQSYWPKVMISRNDRVSRRTEKSSGSTSLSLLEGSTNTLQAEEKETKAACEFNCEENGMNSEEEQDICLISSSSEVQRNLEKTSVENERGLKKFDGLVKDSSEYSVVENETCNTNREKNPIFVDLTTDEKNTWKQNILKRYCDVNTLVRVNDKKDGNDNCSKDMTLEPQIMIADSSSKLNCTGSGSLATALRDRGPCLIPVQPNRSLPIRPAPLVPTRSFRKDCLSLLTSCKPSNLDTVEMELSKSTEMLSSDEVNKEKNNLSEEQIASKNSTTPLNYIVPQISSIESLSEVKKKINDDTKYRKDNVKENKKKKRSQEADSSQSKDEKTESSIKDFLNNFCISNETGEIQNSCTNNCLRVVSTSSKESSGKLVPPLRLKKIVRSEAEKCSDSWVTTETGHELNYRIVTDTTSKPQANPNYSSWNDTFCVTKDTVLASLKTDSYKLKYRRNRLKQKLRELRGKAVDLAQQMANNSISQQNTRLRQMMNRYEKQIENLSKLHNKLSANLSISDEVIDLNDEESSICSLKNNSPVLSPEPPKLSPRSLETHEHVSEEIRDSPPTLSRICLMVSSNQSSIDKDHQVSEQEMWPIDEDIVKPNSTDSFQYNSMDFSASSSKEFMSTIYKTQKSDVNDGLENFNLNFNEKFLNSQKKIIRFFENNETVHEGKKEKNEPVEELPSSLITNQETENTRCFEYSESVPIISSVTNDLESVPDIQDDEIFESTPKKLLSPKKHVLQSNFYGSCQKDISFTKIDDNNRNVQRVTSTSNQLTQFDSIESASREKQLSSPQEYKSDKISNDSVHRSDNNYSIAEQFPTLGNWVARMSKKQTSKMKSKLQTKGNDSSASTETATHISGPEMQKISNTTSNTANTTVKCNTDRWQYYNQQRQQHLLHVPESASFSQAVPTVPPLRSSLCSPLPMSQFYPNNYAIDPCNGSALSYHPAIYPFGNYSYHSRLHPSSLPGYHFSMQESLRSVQHTDKHFPLIQEPMMKYPSSSATNTHHSNLDFNRVEGNIVGNNVGVPTCLPSLFLPPSVLSSSQASLPGYSTNSQFSRNRMIPDVVAAAAAAAVVAAASFNRQRDTLTCNKAGTTHIANVIDGGAHITDTDKTVINRDMANQVQNTCFVEEGHEDNTKYQKMQNFLFDRLAAVKATDNLIQTSSVVDSVAHSAMTSIASTIPYKMSLASPQHTQLPKGTSGSEIRNCETPNLGKVNRTSNSLLSLACSNCGIVGPKFKCLGCEMVFYCDERCQEKHWNIHVQWCPKKMPKLKKVI